MDNHTNKIYARPDAEGIVVDFISTAFQHPEPGDILIEEGNEYHHSHVYDKYKPKDWRERYNYRIAAGQLELIPEEDKPPVLPPGPSEEDQYKAFTLLNLAQISARQDEQDTVMAAILLNQAQLEV